MVAQVAARRNLSHVRTRSDLPQSTQRSVKDEFFEALCGPPRPLVRTV